MALLPFPPGDNSSDTLISAVHYNLTTLRHWNYTYYTNNTFSNGSLCFVLFEPYTPSLLANGTFLNSTSCYSAIQPIGPRATVGLVYTVLFAFSIMFTFMNLAKHGKLFLTRDKRFYAIGRRWQWYWMLAIGAFGMISTITGVDVDRYYLPELPLVLSNFFWYLMLPATMAAVWESVRHWGSWQERQVVDPNPFLLRQDDRRSKVEFYIPLVFYIFFWMNFFMVVPRSWGHIELQRDPVQTSTYAEPTATDIRFKLAALFLFGGWLTTVFSLRHSLKHYKPRNRGILNRALGFVRYTPTKFLLTLSLSLAMIGYDALCAFDFSVSPLKQGTHLGFMYGWGWGSVACIVLVYEVAGFRDPNEDRELVQQRQTRGAEIDAEMGITKKPHWWSRLLSDNKQLGVQDQIARNVDELGGGRATARNLEIAIEMGNMPVSMKQDVNKSGRGDLEAVRAASNLLFPTSPSTKRPSPFHDTPRGRGAIIPPARPRAITSDRSDSANSGVSTSGNPQVIKSMLDI